LIRIRVLERVQYSWVVVALCIFAATSGSYWAQGMGALFPFIQDDLGTSRAQLGLILSGRGAGAIAALLLAGWLADVVGVRRLQAVSLMGLCVGLLLFSQIQSLVQGVLLAFAIGVVASARLPANTKAMMDWVTPQYRGRAVGIWQSTNQVNGMIAVVLLTLLSVSFSWRNAVMVLAFIAAVASVVFFAFYREKPGSYGEEGKGIGLGARLRLVTKNRDLWVAGLCGVGFTGTLAVTISYLILFLREDLGMSAGEAAGCLAAAMAGGAVGRVGWGLVSDLLMSGRLVRTLGLVGVLSVVSLSFLAWLPSDASLSVVLVLAFIVGITVMGSTGLLLTMVAQLGGPHLTGTATGFVFMIVHLGSVGAPPLFGLVVDRTGSYDWAWLMMVGLAAGGVLLLPLLRPQPARS